MTKIKFSKYCLLFLANLSNIYYKTKRRNIITIILNKTLGNELKSCRESKKFTLREIEEITGISNAYLSQLENNKIKKPSANILYKLAKIYKIDFDFLLETAGVIERKEKKKGPKSLSGFALYSKDLTDDEEKELVKYLKFLRFSERKNDKK